MNCNYPKIHHTKKKTSSLRYWKTAFRIPILLLLPFTGYSQSDFGVEANKESCITMTTSTCNELFSSPISFSTSTSMAVPVPSNALTLDRAREIAIERYPLMAEYNLITLTEEYNVENAAKAWLPQLSLGAQATWQTEVASYPDVLKEMLSSRGLEIKGMDKLQYKASLEVRQNIWDGGRTKAAQDLFRAQAQEQQRQNDVELYQLRNRIDGIFFGILLLEEQSKAITQSIELLQANLERVRSLVRNGAAMLSDADAVEVELLSSRQQLIGVDSTIEAYRSILGIYLGTQGKESLEMPSDVMFPSNNNCALRPEQSLLNARLSTLEAQERSIKAMTRPQIGALAQGMFGYPGLNFMQAMMNRNPRLNAMIGISASWNISSLYTKKNKLAQVQAARSSVSIAREIFDFNTNIQATQQRNEIDRLRKLSESDEQIVRLRTRVRKASEARLREGVVEPTDLLMRITEEKNAIIASKAHRIQYLQAVYSLLNTLNQNPLD